MGRGGDSSEGQNLEGESVRPNSRLGETWKLMMMMILFSSLVQYMSWYKRVLYQKQRLRVPPFLNNLEVNNYINFKDTYITYYFSTQLINPKFCVSTRLHRCSTTVSL